MKRQNQVFVAFIALGVVIFFGYRELGWDKFFKNFINAPVLTDSRGEDSEKVRAEAWQVVEEYLGYAKAHDLEGVRRLSHQLSTVCLDESRREECNGLMDSIYNIINLYRPEDFKHAISDGKRVTLYTDYMGDVRAGMFFIRGEGGSLKMAGMKFCYGNVSTPDECSVLR